MGNRCGKSSANKRKSISDKTFSMPSSLDITDSSVRVQSIQKDDEYTIRVLEKELRENPQTFVINNMIMATQFLGNHKETILQLQHSSASPTEKELNKTLLKDETMNYCTYPDAIFEKVRENVIYRNFKEDSQSESLISQRIYVVNDLVEVVSTSEVPQYTVIDKPSYQVKMEESTRKGFVKLQQVEVTTTPKYPYSEWATDYEPLPGPSNRSDEEYGYNTITDLRTPKPIEIQEDAERRDTLPETCFSQRKVRKIPDEYLDGENEEEILKHLAPQDLYKEITFINSQGFMKYFSNVIFPGSLGEKLGFDEKDIQCAKTIPGKIFCDKFNEETEVITGYEVIPSIAIPWPEQRTLPYMEFHEREERPTMITRKGVTYRWPTPNMVKEILSMNCALVPVGYHKKKGEHKDSDLEWEIHFPKAERYLEARMSHAQMKCYLVLLALHKTYIAERTFHQGLLVEHIRIHMFWECENDYRNWPEHRLGTKIILVIQNLIKRLRQCHLPHYFIKQKNVFENIPKKYLHYAQKVFLNILEEPALHFMKPLRNIRYTKGKFYPPLNYKELYENLTSSKGLELLNQDISNLPRRPNFTKKVYNDPDIQLKHMFEIQKRREIWRKRNEKAQKELLAKRGELEQMEADNDWIKLEAAVDKQLNMYKTKALLDIFVKNFIEVAKVSAKISTREQAKFYLKQALYLTYIMEDTSRVFLGDADDYRKCITDEENYVKRIVWRSGSQQREEKPNVPLRNGLGPISNVESHISHAVPPGGVSSDTPARQTNMPIRALNGIPSKVSKKETVTRKKVAFA